MPCECRTGARRLVVLARSLEEYPELVELGAMPGCTLHRPLEAVAMDLAEGSTWAGVADAAAFLRAVLDEARFAALRAAWVEPARTLEEQVVKLIHAERLADLAPVDSSPLAALLAERRLETWFQPIFWAGTLELWGYECLARGRGADGSVVGALDLLGWARQENLTFMLDRVLRETHLKSAGAAAVPEHCSFLLNFLPTAIYRPEFCLATTLRAAREAGLEFDRVLFEVVETDRVADRDHLRRILSYYREQGFRVALDDVGSGYAGLTLLADLDPDLIKIDRELVRKAVASSFHRGICASLVKLGQDNGEMVLAEGVETEAEWEVMESLGVNLLQGYLFGRPDPVPAVTARVPARHPRPGARALDATV